MELFTVKFLNKGVFYVCYFAFVDFSFNSMQKYCINCSGFTAILKHSPRFSEAQK